MKSVQSIVNQERGVVNRQLLHRGKYCSFLLLAAERGSLEIIQFLLDNNAHVNHQCMHGHSALFAAASRGHSQVVDLLLQQPNIRVDLVETLGNTPLTVSIQKGHVNVCRQLLLANSDANSVDGYDKSCLFLAVDRGSVALTSLLLEHNADVHYSSSSCDRCLCVAARQGFDDVVSALLRGNAQIDAPDIVLGYSPLMASTDHKRHSTVQLLLKAGANVNYCSTGMETALQRGTFQRDTAIVETLLRANAAPNAADAAGSTALITAATCGGSTCVPALLAAKADIESRNHRGESALLVAVMRRDHQTAKLLLDNGASALVKTRTRIRQRARRACFQLKSLFHCAVCGWEGKCCPNCRKNYCAKECDKFLCEIGQSTLNRLLLHFAHIASLPEVSPNPNCLLHAQIAHQSVLEWTLAVSSLQLPPYVLEHIFNALKFNSNKRDYQQRTANDFLWIPDHLSIDKNFVHLIIEEREHQENIKLFIAVQKAFQNRK